MWQEIFKIVFFVEPASGNILIDLLLPTVLTSVFYGISYSMVGDMYGSGFQKFIKIIYQLIISPRVRHLIFLNIQI